MCGVWYKATNWIWIIGSQLIIQYYFCITSNLLAELTVIVIQRQCIEIHTFTVNFVQVEIPFPMDNFQFVFLVLKKMFFLMLLLHILIHLVYIFVLQYSVISQI